MWGRSPLFADPSAMMQRVPIHVSRRDHSDNDEVGQTLADNRREAWGRALDNEELPDFVEKRLKDAAGGKAPWLATMTPAELLLAKSHGLRPLATVSGTCWFHYGYSWTQGHIDGWEAATTRIGREALAVGANAVVDVQMRTIQSPNGDSMDFTLFGTAVKIDGLPPSTDPVIGTVSAIEFVRLLEMGVAVCGIAIGGAFEYLYTPPRYGPMGGYISGGENKWRYLDVQTQLHTEGTNTSVAALTQFWESVRRKAHDQLRESTGRRGNGVLAKTQFGQLLHQEGKSANFIGRHIVIGTVVETRRGAAVPHHIETVVDMRDQLSPLRGGGPHAADFGVNNELAGGLGLPTRKRHLHWPRRRGSEQ